MPAMKVKFIILGGEAREVEVEEGTTAEEAARRAGLNVEGYSLRVRAEQDVVGPATPLTQPVSFVTLEPRTMLGGGDREVVATPKVEAG